MHRRPRFGVLARRNKRRGHHTDDGVHVATERNGFTENLLVAIELFRPQVMTQNHHERRAVFIVVAVDKTTALGFDAERFKESAADLSDLKLSWLTAARVR